MALDEELEKLRKKKLRELMMRMLREDSKSIEKPITVTESTFADVIRRSRLVVIDCWAPWCAPCRYISPIIDELARKYAGRILFGKLNVDENPKITMQYDIMSIPTLLIFKDGALKDRVVGAIPKEVLEQRITRFL